jgi:hypothetical protein
LYRCASSWIGTYPLCPNARTSYSDIPVTVQRSTLLSGKTRSYLSPRLPT